MEGIRKEDLGDGVWLYTAPSCPVTTDSLLLAAFSAGCASPPSGKKKIRAADLGAGCGILPFIWSKDPRFTSILGVELQPGACRLAQAAAREQGLEERLRFVCRDFKQIGGPLQRESFDLVACNPPYFEVSAGKISPDPARAAARTQLTGSLQDAAASAAAMLRFGGAFCICHRPERLCGVLETMRRNRLEPKKLQAVQPREGMPPSLILICGKKGGKPGLEMLPVRVLTTERGK